ncbi:hypothetical protein SPRG_21380 [Saprolegnia parasitica CBS 223.65]|uniref:Uncharacterized protein n=1 Tax=Saprolegnia parasitica (strain CBS 223.65) TaxID=695850 RepID=A0A067C248_SAPPC|nr:hypothetical protein SPRG_21380 [Saprolegnia parasitica CBS 223.65]KDO20887.1 hypothetical protein SPRG_21380 [Saprolegnia parasitica CBS 223.65]|eukprot:XP_012208413.1 hypothetical protein SPRG_21380 [Saprolegnia parasitica CBS 223.65]
MAAAVGTTQSLRSRRCTSGEWRVRTASKSCLPTSSLFSTEPWLCWDGWRGVDDGRCKHVDTRAIWRKEDG